MLICYVAPDGCFAIKYKQLVCLACFGTTILRTENGAASQSLSSLPRRHPPAVRLPDVLRLLHKGNGVRLTCQGTQEGAKHDALPALHVYMDVRRYCTCAWMCNGPITYSLGTSLVRAPYLPCPGTQPTPTLSTPQQPTGVGQLTPDGRHEALEDVAQLSAASATCPRLLHHAAALALPVEKLHTPLAVGAGDVAVGQLLGRPRCVERDRDALPLPCMVNNDGWGE